MDKVSAVSCSWKAPPSPHSAHAQIQFPRTQTHRGRRNGFLPFSFSVLSEAGDVSEIAHLDSEGCTVQGPPRHHGVNPTDGELPRDIVRFVQLVVSVATQTSAPIWRGHQVPGSLPRPPVKVARPPRESRRHSGTKILGATKGNLRPASRARVGKTHKRTRGQEEAPCAVRGRLGEEGATLTSPASAAQVCACEEFSLRHAREPHRAVSSAASRTKRRHAG